MGSQASENPPADEPPRIPWQYSLRGLFAVMAIVSVCLAIGVYFAGFMLALLAFGLIQSALLMLADWLVRPANRRALAFATAISWTIAGSGLILLGAHLTSKMDDVADAIVAGFFAIGLMVGGGVCYFLAVKRWRQMTVQRRTNR